MVAIKEAELKELKEDQKLLERVALGNFALQKTLIMAGLVLFGLVYLLVAYGVFEFGASEAGRITDQDANSALTAIEPLEKSKTRDVVHPETEVCVGCPECSGRMVLVEKRGNQFFGCSNYPDCKMGMPYPFRCVCGEEMVLRTRRSDGKKFWGCSTFPKCKRTNEYFE